MGCQVLGVRGISQVTRLSLGLAFKLLVPVTHPSPDTLGSNWTKYLNSVPAFCALWAIFLSFLFSIFNTSFIFDIYLSPSSGEIRGSSCVPQIPTIFK